MHAHANLALRRADSQIAGTPVHGICCEQEQPPSGYEHEAGGTHVPVAAAKLAGHVDAAGAAASIIAAASIVAPLSIVAPASPIVWVGVAVVVAVVVGAGDSRGGELHATSAAMIQALANIVRSVPQRARW
jgi:hypothetical protein